MSRSKGRPYWSHKDSKVCVWTLPATHQQLCPAIGAHGEAEARFCGATGKEEEEEGKNEEEAITSGNRREAGDGVEGVVSWRSDKRLDGLLDELLSLDDSADCDTFLSSLCARDRTRILEAVSGESRGVAAC